MLANHLIDKRNLRIEV